MTFVVAARFGFQAANQRALTTLSEVGERNAAAYGELVLSGIRKFDGWFLTVLGAAALLLGAPLMGALLLVMGLFVLTLAYRVSSMLGVRLPWVRAHT